MHREINIQDGWNFISKIMTSEYTAGNAGDYVDAVDAAIQEFAKSLNTYEGNKAGIKQLKGNIAEEWHAKTFNIHAALNGSKHRASVLHSNDHASVDVTTNFGHDYQMKYYATANESARQQAKDVLQAYHEYVSKSQLETPLSFEEYIKKYGYSDEMQELLTSVYSGQGRVIPSDQLNDAIEYLKREIAKESCSDAPNRIHILNKYKETLENLSDRIRNGDGIESVPLSREEAETLALLCKEGKFNPEDFGFSLDSLITPEYLMQQALKAGYTSAVIALVFQLAPEIYKAFDYLIRNGEIDTEQLKIAGFKAISAGATGFLNGSVSAALTIACKSGKLGTSLMTISPQVIGAMTVIVLDTMKNSLLVAIKKKTPQEMGTELAKELLISSASLGGGVIGQALVPELPVLGYMLGSFLGSTIASVGIQVGEKTLISFCIQSGFTCFGLVEQDYQLPKSVLEQMGIKTLDIQRVNIRHAKINRCAIAHAQVNHLQISTIQITVVQRGLIAVNKIGYMI